MSRIRHAAQKIATQHADNQYAVQNTHQADIDPHVAVKNMAEFMGNNALQFIPVQLFQCSTRHGYYGFVWFVAGSECID